MKPLIFVFAFIVSAVAFAKPMYLPAKSVTLYTQAIGDSPECRAVVDLDFDLRYISRATLFIGGKKYDFPSSALTGIEYPDLGSLRIETEKGRDERVWYSLVLKPGRHTEYPTRFHISVIGGRFAQVSKSWDETQGNHIRRHFEVLHDEKQ